MSMSLRPATFMLIRQWHHAPQRCQHPSHQHRAFSCSSPSLSITPDPLPSSASSTDTGPHPNPQSHAHLSLRTLRAKGVHLPWLFNQDPPRLATRDALVPINQVRARDLPFPRNLGFPLARLACDYLAYKWTTALFVPNNDRPDDAVYSSEQEFLDGARAAIQPALHAALSFDPSSKGGHDPTLTSARSLFSRPFYDRLLEQYETLANIDPNLAVKLSLNKVHDNAYIRARFALAGDKNVLLAHPSSSTKAVSIGPLSMVARKKPRLSHGSHPSDGTSATTLFNTDQLVMPATPQDVAVQVHMDVAVSVDGSIAIHDMSAKNSGEAVVVHEDFVDREVIVRFASVPIGVTEDHHSVQWMVWDVDYWIEAEMRDNEE